MNCKQGDLAIVIKSYQGNLGKIVRCLEYIPNFKWEGLSNGAWYVEGNITNIVKKGNNYIHDSQLKPLKDNDGEDESFTWAGKPEIVKEK